MPLALPRRGCPSPCARAPCPGRPLAFYALPTPSAHPSGASLPPHQHAAHPRAAPPLAAPPLRRCASAQVGRGVAHLKQWFLVRVRVRVRVRVPTLTLILTLTLTLVAKTLAPQPGHVQSPARTSLLPPPPPPEGKPPKPPPAP